MSSKSEGRDYSAIAVQFEADVASGAFPCGALFKKAVERQVREVANPPAGYEWDPARADRACGFAESLAYPKGPKRGQPFDLGAWQIWLIRCLFGWVDAVTKLPRFSIVTIFLPKGNGKTPLAAIIGLNVVARGRRIGAKVYCAATAQKQAREVFEAAQEMLRLSPELRDEAGLVVGEHAIKGIGDNRIFEAVSSEHKSAEGKVPDCVIIDEIHVHPDRSLYDNLCSAASKVDGSRVVVISTAGNDMSPEAIGYQVYCEARDILLGKLDVPAQFALISEADRKLPDGRDADPFSLETWRQANPNLGVSISIPNLHTIAKKVKHQPSAQPDFYAKRLGWWSQSISQFLDVQRWNELAEPGLSLDDIDPSEWALVLGADLAKTQDLTALPALAVRRWAHDQSKREYRVFTRHVWVPEQSEAVQLNRSDYEVWARDGWINLVPQPSMTYGPLKDAVIALRERFPTLEACFDDMMAAEVENDLEAQGVEVLPVRQGWRTQSVPMSELESAILDGRLRHDGSPVAAMCIANLQAKHHGNGAISPERENKSKKIDVAVGIINALVRGMAVDVPEPVALEWV